MLFRVALLVASIVLCASFTGCECGGSGQVPRTQTNASPADQTETRSTYPTLAELGGECVLGDPIEVGRVRTRTPELAMAYVGDTGYLAIRRLPGHASVQRLDAAGKTTGAETDVELPGRGQLGLRPHTLGVDVFTATEGCPEIEGECFAITRVDPSGNVWAAPTYDELTPGSKIIGAVDLQGGVVVALASEAVATMFMIEPTAADLFEIKPTLAEMLGTHHIAKVDGEPMLIAGPMLGAPSSDASVMTMSRSGAHDSASFPQHVSLLAAEHEGALGLLYKRVIIRDDAEGPPLPRGEPQFATITKEGVLSQRGTPPSDFAGRVFMRARFDSGVRLERMTGAGESLPDVIVHAAETPMVEGELVRVLGGYVVLYGVGEDDMRVVVYTRRVTCGGLTTGSPSGTP